MRARPRTFANCPKTGIYARMVLRSRDDMIVPLGRARNRARIGLAADAALSDRACMRAALSRCSEKYARLSAARNRAHTCGRSCAPLSRVDPTVAIRTVGAAIIVSLLACVPSPPTTQQQQRCPSAATTNRVDAGPDPLAGMYAGLCKSQSRSSFISLDGDDCRAVVPLLNDPTSVTHKLIEDCAKHTEIGRYFETVTWHKAMAPETYRRRVIEKLADASFTACTWCYVLAERDLSLSLLLEEPIDRSAAESHFKSACRHSLGPPALTFADGRHPCTYVGGDIAQTARSISNAQLNFGRKCFGNDLVFETGDVERAF